VQTRDALCLPTRKPELPTSRDSIFVEPSVIIHTSSQLAWHKEVQFVSLLLQFCHFVNFAFRDSPDGGQSSRPRFATTARTSLSPFLSLFVPLLSFLSRIPSIAQTATCHTKLPLSLLCWNPAINHLNMAPGRRASSRKSTLSNLDRTASPTSEPGKPSIENS
jgi:hypothetical protein